MYDDDDDDDDENRHHTPRAFDVLIEVLLQYLVLKN